MTSPDPTSPYATGGYVPTPSPATVGPAETFTRPPKRLRWLLILVPGAALALLILVLIIGMAIGRTGDNGAASKAPSAWDREQSANAAPVDTGEQGAPTEQPTPGPTLHASDITLSLKTTSKQCYGYGVGCSLTVQVKMAYTGLTPDPGDTWQVTYEISGIENGPLVGSFEVTGDTYDSNEEMVDTKSSKAKPTIKVTSVEKVGL